LFDGQQSRVVEFSGGVLAHGFEDGDDVH